MRAESCTPIPCKHPNQANLRTADFCIAVFNTQIIDDLNIAAQALREGKVVAFPTETVYGLGADATNPEAVRRLFEAKGRPGDNPLIVHLGSKSQLLQAALDLPEDAYRLLDAFSPGPITVVVRKQPQICDSVTAGLDTVGIRIPSDPQAAELLRLVNRPIAAPSANLSGRPSCTTWQSVLEDMNGRIDYLFRGNISRIGIESSVVLCTGLEPILLRPGDITLEDIRRVLPKAKSWREVVESQPHSSPGLRHPHYRPVAIVQLISTTDELSTIPANEVATSAYAEYSPNQPQCDSVATSLPSNIDASQFLLYAKYHTIAEYASGFYEFLREADRKGATKIYLRRATADSSGQALLDRQLRAAGLDS